MIEFEPPSAEFMTELRGKHGNDIREIEDGGRVFVLVKPENPRGHLERFTTLGSDEKKRLEATEGLVKQCVAWPDKDTMKRVLADEPGMAFSLGDPATELLGIRKLAVKKG